MMWLILALLAYSFRVLRKAVWRISKMLVDVRIIWQTLGDNSAEAEAIRNKAMTRCLGHLGGACIDFFRHTRQLPA